MNNEELWQAALGELELSLSKVNFTTWFKNTFISSFSENKVIISVPNTFTKTWLEQKYNKMIFKSLRDTDTEIKDVKYVIDKQELKVFKIVNSPEDVLPANGSLHGIKKVEAALFLRLIFSLIVPHFSATILITSTEG
mgnify:CR=1 FL=1